MENNQYQSLLDEIKDIVEQSRIKALISVNAELLKLYWQIGKSILEKQAQKGWGAKIIDSLAVDLSQNFPDMRGFSVRNLKNMRKFAEAYPDFQIVQTLSAQLSWSHHILLLDKFSDEQTRLCCMCLEFSIIGSLVINLTSNKTAVPAIDLFIFDNQQVI